MLIIIRIIVTTIVTIVSFTLLSLTNQQFSFNQEHEQFLATAQTQDQEIDGTRAELR